MAFELRMRSNFADATHRQSHMDTNEDSIGDGSLMS